MKIVCIDRLREASKQRKIKVLLVVSEMVVIKMLSRRFISCNVYSLMPVLQPETHNQYS